VRSLYDCPDVPVGSHGGRCRVVVATHSAGTQKSRVGVTRSGVVYELFFTDLPQRAFTASDVVELYLHRGAFEPALADEDVEQDPDRWCSQSPCGQECWQIVSQWVWNLRLELGHQLKPTPTRITEFAPAITPVQELTTNSPAPTSGYSPPAPATSWKAGRFSGKDFAFQPDGTLKCPAGKTLHPTEQRTEQDGSLRVLYAARIGDCRVCPLREQCQWHGRKTTKPRRVSLLLHPLPLGSASLRLRRIGVVERIGVPACRGSRRQRVDVTLEPALPPHPKASPPILSRARRAHYRLSFAERLARNARDTTAARPTITLFGVPDTFAAFLGLSTLQ
jgi:hypothetical protein